MKCLKTSFYLLKVVFFLVFSVTFILGGVLYLNAPLRSSVIKAIFNEAATIKLTEGQSPPLQHKFDPSKNRQWIVKQRPVGELTKEVFEFKVVDKPTISEGQVLIRHTHFSFDPTQKFWMTRDTYKKATPLGSPVEATTIGVVVESQNPNYEVGDQIATLGTWQDYAVYDPKQEQADLAGAPVVIPKGVSPYVFLNVMTDFTAIGGILRVGQIKPGDKVLVSGAAGATGSVAGQAAKLLGASLVVGIAGGKQKKDLLTSTFKFDRAIDYKSEDVKKRINDIFGKSGGIDVYFDNVGGETLNLALGNISMGGRLVLCGAISQYNTEESAMKVNLPNYFNLVLKGASMEGFLVMKYFADPGVFLRWFYWQYTGQLVRHVQKQKNFDNLPDTLISLFQGSNVGKLVLENDYITK